MGNQSVAEMYTLTGKIGIINPSDFERPLYVEFKNKSFFIIYKEGQADEDPRERMTKMKRRNPFTGKMLYQS
ncbi:MAG: hypothetical protein DBX59_07770 [Bacillota bacterium]|nr:MAG: hypothetical protein DBX59_07770 [Bacillota bacterium]